MQKQQNPSPLASLFWATGLIARLGGWSGYRLQRLPGMPTLVHGLRQFDSIFLGWQLAQPPRVHGSPKAGEHSLLHSTAP